MSLRPPSFEQNFLELWQAYENNNNNDDTKKNQHLNLKNHNNDLNTYENSISHSSHKKTQEFEENCFSQNNNEAEIHRTTTSSVAPEPWDQLQTNLSRRLQINLLLNHVSGRCKDGGYTNDDGSYDRYRYR